MASIGPSPTLASWMISFSAFLRATEAVGIEWEPHETCTWSIVKAGFVFISSSDSEAIISMSSS